MRFVIDARTVRATPSGIGTYVGALVEHLPPLGPDDHFRWWAHPSRPRPARGPNVSHRVVRGAADGFETLLAPQRLDALSPEDVVHFPSSILGRGLRCATVVTIHDLMWLDHPELVDGRGLRRRVRQRYYQTGMRWALRHATRIIAVSNATADRILEHAPGARGRLVVTPNAASSAFRPPEDPAESRRAVTALIGTAAPYYLVVGKNEPYKAHSVALEAFAAAAKGDERMVLVQRENTGRGLRGLVEELGIRDRVIWSPPFSDEHLAALMGSAEALLQPSIVEGFGLPALEAIACGCPVIASDTPALVEVLGGAALHARVGDVRAFVEAMKRLRDGARRAELRVRGVERAGDFSWERTARDTLDVYRSARAEPGRGR